MSSHGWSSLSHTNVEEEGPTHERDDCDIEMEELRMQVLQLQQCLEHYKALKHDVKVDILEFVRKMQPDDLVD